MDWCQREIAKGRWVPLCRFAKMQGNVVQVEASMVSVLNKSHQVWNDWLLTQNLSSRCSQWRLATLRWNWYEFSTSFRVWTWTCGEITAAKDFKACHLKPNSTSAIGFVANERQSWSWLSKLWASCNWSIFVYWSKLHGLEQNDLRVLQILLNCMQLN